MDSVDCATNGCWYGTEGFASCWTRGSNEGARCILNYEDAAHPKAAVSSTEIPINRWICPGCAESFFTPGDIEGIIECRCGTVVVPAAEPPPAVASTGIDQPGHPRDGDLWAHPVRGLLVWDEVDDDWVPVSDMNRGTECIVGGLPHRTGTFTVDYSEFARAVTSMQDMIDRLANGFVPVAQPDRYARAEPGYSWDVMHTPDAEETPPNRLR